MNTRKQVLIMSALLLMMLIIVGAYAAWLPGRETAAGVEFQDQTANRGAILFSRNCRLCHGDVGEGGALGGRVPAAPALDRPDLQGFIDSKTTLASAVTATDTTIPVGDGTKFKTAKTIIIDDERMDVKGIDGNSLKVERGTYHSDPAAHDANTAIQALDPDTLANKITYITNTITCGHVGTDMQPWAATQGGTLSVEQIRQLMTLITQRRWDLVAEDNDVTDLLATKLLDPVSGNDTSIHVSDVSVLLLKQTIRIGDERMLITNVPTLTKNAAGALPTDRSGVVQVTRGTLNTTPLDHEVTEKVFNFPDATVPGLNASACGQTAQAPAPAVAPTIIPDPFDGQSVTVTASNISFDTKTITLKAGGKVRVKLDNKDSATDHNIAFYKSSSDTTPVSTGSVGPKVTGPAEGDISFDVPAAGTYYFRCDVHPTIMQGTLTVTP